MKLLTGMLCLLVVSAAPVLAADALAPVVGPYLRVQETLAADSVAGVAEQAAAIAAAAARLGKPADGVTAAAKQLQATTAIGPAREAFYALTTALFAYADANKVALGDAVRRAYCPMEKKSWAQRDGQISNPYAGKKMPRCGEFTDKKGS